MINLSYFKSEIVAKYKTDLKISISLQFYKLGITLSFYLYLWTQTLDLWGGSQETCPVSGQPLLQK